MYVLVALLGFILDRIVKGFVYATSPTGEGSLLFGDSFGFTRYLNTEFAWGLPLSNEASTAIMLVVLSVLIALVARSLLIRKDQALAPLWLVVAGAFSNVADRLIFGGVVDYIAVPWGGVVNIADAMIIAGIAIVLLKKA